MTDHGWDTAMRLAAFAHVLALNESHDQLTTNELKPGLRLRVLVLTPPAKALERRYALRAVKQRLHQASFREAVITAYNGRCALSGLQESLLLDAAAGCQF